MKWYEKDGLETWYLKNKCDNFLMNPDEHFEKMNIVNFDIIKINVSEEKIKQYNFIDHHEIMRYLPEMCEEIFSSIFRNGDRKDMHVKKKHTNILKIQKRYHRVLGGERLLKKLEMTCISSLGSLFFFVMYY